MKLENNFFITNPLKDAKKVANLMIEFSNYNCKNLNIEGPVISPDYDIDYFKELENCHFNEEYMNVEELKKYFSWYFKNSFNWNHIGTMINIIPPTNIYSNVIGML